MGDITYLETIHRNKIPVAEVKLNNEELAAKTNLSHHISRTALLSTIAAKQAVDDADIKNFFFFENWFHLCKYSGRNG